MKFLLWTVKGLVLILAVGLLLLWPTALESGLTENTVLGLDNLGLSNADKGSGAANGVTLVPYFCATTTRSAKSIWPSWLKSPRANVAPWVLP